jgi:hypothetical protein
MSSKCGHLNKTHREDISKKRQHSKINLSILIVIYSLKSYDLQVF